MSVSSNSFTAVSRRYVLLPFQSLLLMQEELMINDVRFMFSTDLVLPSCFFKAFHKADTKLSFSQDSCLSNGGCIMWTGFQMQQKIAQNL